MPTGLPEPRPNKPRQDEDGPKEKNYTPEIGLGLPVSKLTADRLVEEAIEDATGVWEKPNLDQGSDVGRFRGRSLFFAGLALIGMLIWIVAVATSDKVPEEQGQGKLDFSGGFGALETRLQGMVTKFLSAEDWSDVSDLIRGGDRIGEQLAIYQRRSPKKPAGVKLFRPIDIIMVKGDQSLYMLGVQDDSDKVSTVYFTSSEPHKIIWETFVAYCDTPFERLASVTDPPETKGIYRVYAQSDGYYVGGYEADSWQSLKLTYPFSEKQINAYIKRNSPQAEKLKPLLNKRKGKVPVVLSIVPLGSSAQGLAVEVLDLLGVGWHELAADGVSAGLVEPPGEDK